MLTTEGKQLTTCGMVVPKTSCTELNQSTLPFSACFTFPATKSNPRFSAWITDENNKWKRSGRFSMHDGAVMICTDETTFEKGYNGDEEMAFFCLVRDSSKLRILRHTFPNCAIKGGIQPEKAFTCGATSSSAYNRFPCDRCKDLVYKTLAVDADNQLWLCSEPLFNLTNRPTITIEDTVTGIKVATLRHYQPIFFSDTTHVIKVKRRLKVTALHYVLPDADTTFAFERISKRKFQAKVLNYPHKLAFETVGARRFGKDPASITKRFRTRKQRWQGKVKKF